MLLCLASTSAAETPEDDFIEGVVCKESDLNENEMKTFELGDDSSNKVLVVKQKGQISAIGPKCTHYGAPLVNGALGDGRIRCQWHGACFNILTGDIEDFPGKFPLKTNSLKLIATFQAWIRCPATK